MRKITKTFKSPLKIRKLKKLMKDVYKAKSNHLAEIAKLNLKKNIIPKDVEKIEIEINSLIGKELITLPHNSLTFLTGATPPFTQVDNNSVIEDQYIVLPWSISSNGGREALKSLTSKIPLLPISLTYTIHVNINEGSNQSYLDTTQSTAREPAIIPQSQLPATEQPEVITEVMEDYSWTGSSFSEDNEEMLLTEIDKLRQELESTKNNYNNAANDVTAKNRQISNLQIQINNLNGQINQKQLEISNLNNQLSQKNNQYTNISNQLASVQTQTSNLTQQIRNIEYEADVNNRKFLDAKYKLDMIRQGGEVYMCSDLGDAVQFRVRWFTGSFRVYRDANFDNKHFQIWRSQEQYNKLIV
ncbi:hypothetical protein [Rickettsia endosymbiont of Orchestes rusci]|uniref:hypothetical protein n=1 Tax=Rickettsia endosymbiont of Orchestes rusci TaxID=3066250 RepID=UPI00313BB6ED